MIEIGLFPMAGAIVFNADGETEILTETARHILAGSDAVEMRGARLHAIDSIADVQLQHTIAECTRGDPAVTSGITYYVALSGRSSHLALYFTALSERVGAAAADAKQPRALALISASPDSGFTAAEHAVAELLWSGLPLRGIAEHRGTSLETIRTQAKAIYAKLGVQSRTQMMAAAVGRELRIADMRPTEIAQL